MKSPVMIIPDAMKALYALRSSAEKGGVPQRLLTLLELRVSQINGCSLCVDMHVVELKQQGEKDERIFAVAAWRDRRSLRMPNARRWRWPNLSPVSAIGRILSPTRSGMRPPGTTTSALSPDC